MRERELHELRAEISRQERIIADLHSELRALRTTQQNRVLAESELQQIKSSLTFQALRAFDDLRRGRVLEFVRKFRGFVRHRGGKLIQRLLPGGPNGAPRTLPRWSPPVRIEPPAPPWHELRSRLAALLPANPPLVSAIVPCFNYGRLVAEAAGTLFAQSYPNLEILIVDDGSTDRVTLATLESLACRGARVIRQANQGLSAARNAGARESRGDFLIFLDNDDLLEPDAVSLLVARLLDATDAAFAYPQQWFFGDQSLVWQPQEFNAYDLLWSNHPSVCALIRREAFAKVEGYSRELRHGCEDWDHWISLVQAGERGISVPVPLFKHRRHGVTMTHRAQEKIGEVWAALLLRHEELYRPAALSALKRQWRPLVSVIVPFHDAHEHFPDTLHSLRRQTIEDLEILVVNDGSSDPASIALLAELRTRSDVRVVDREQGGPAAARNTGALQARGDFLLFLDADDLLAPTAVEKLAWAALFSARVEYLYPGVVHFGDMSAVCLDPFDVERLKQENFLTTTALIPRHVYVEVGGMDERLTDLHEDYDFWLRLACLGVPGRLFPEALFQYRRHAGGRSASIRSVMTDTDVRDRLRRRNPEVFGDTKAPVPARPAPLRDSRPRPLCEDVVDGFRRRYRTDLGQTIPFESFRRKNVPLPFLPRRWESAKIQVLYFVPCMVVGGAERVDLDILQGLDPARYHVTLVVDNDYRLNNNLWQERFEDSVDEVFILPNIVPPADKKGALAFLEYLLISRCVDLVFVRNSAIGYRASREWRERYTQLRCVDLLHLHAFGKDWVRGSIPYRSGLDRTFVTNEDLLDYANKEHGLATDRFRVIHCGIDPGKWDSSKTQRGRLRAELEIGPDIPLVGFVGRLADQKEPILWVQAAGEILKQVPDARFAMIGDGPLVAATKREVRNRGLESRLRLLGHREDVADLMSDMDVLMLTSGYEGLPQVAMESLALGVPVVSSDVGGTKECVTEGLGRLVAPGSSPQSFATAAAALLGDRHGACARRLRAQAWIRSHFTIERMCAAYRREFEDLAGGLDRERRRREYARRLMEQPLL